MKMKKVTIEVPPGYELVQTGEGKWELRKIERDLPKTWAEFCINHPISKDYIIDTCSTIGPAAKRRRSPRMDKNVLPDRATAEAILALMQLIQLRNFYNGDWEPDWTDVSEQKYVITNKRGKLNESYSITMSYVLAFRTEEICAQFLKNFRDLIEIAKPLI